MKVFKTVEQRVEPGRKYEADSTLLRKASEAFEVLDVRTGSPGRWEETRKPAWEPNDLL
jgi:hypothetical protein